MTGMNSKATPPKGRDTGKGDTRGDGLQSSIESLDVFSSGQFLGHRARPRKWVRAM